MTVGRLEEVEQVTKIISSFSWSEVVIRCKSSVSFASRLFSPQGLKKDESSDSGRPVLRAKIGLMNKA